MGGDWIDIQSLSGLLCVLIGAVGNNIVIVLDLCVVMCLDGCCYNI